MALKIVHLCDVHSNKGEDVPATFAHSVVVDGGTYAIDLCRECDDERYVPLVAFLDAFGLLTDGSVDPREAVAENLRAVASAAMSSQSSQSAQPLARATGSASAASSASETRQSVQKRAQKSADEPDELAELVQGFSELNVARMRKLRELLLAQPTGVGIAELSENVDASPTATSKLLTTLSHAGKAEFLRRRWHAPEHVTPEERAALARAREIVRQRDQTPRICVLCGDELHSTSAWDAHCRTTHDASPADIHGLTCPLDGETFESPQLMGMHGRTQHDAPHTPHLFAQAVAQDDPLGIVALRRARFEA